MILLRKISLLVGIFIYLIIGLILYLIITFSYPYLRLRIISHWTKIINGLLRKILRVRVTIEGERSYLKEKGNFIISNHLSYLDGVILGSLFPIVFVSKSQVRGWPIFGLMTIIGGTIFINRKRRLRSPEYIGQIARALKRKINVLVFPEGTSTDGSKLLGFQSVFFEAPLITSASIIPVSLQYIKIDGQETSSLNRDKVCWYGQIKFSKHLNKILELKKIEARIIIHPKIDPVRCLLSNGVEIKKDLKDLQFRKDLSEASRQVILKDLSFIR